MRPRHRFPKIAAQRGCFTFHPREFDGHIPEGAHLHRFEVPASAKEETLDRLDLLGVDESAIWPGPEGVANAIRRQWELG